MVGQAWSATNEAPSLVLNAGRYLRNGRKILDKWERLIKQVLNAGRYLRNGRF